jgi:galactokinase
MDPTDLRRARHAITECRRTLDAAAALEAGDLPVLGDLMLASHESLRTDYQVSCPELDDLAAAARTIPGIHGARMTGAGFGGCIVALADADRAEAAARTLSDGGRCFCMVTDAVGAGGTLSPESHAPRP